MEEALRRVGKRVVLALPLGIGKPNLIANEFFRRARADATLDLTIFTALSLRKPTGSSELEKAFHRAAGGARLRQLPGARLPVRRCGATTVPPNVRVIEFFFEPGSLLQFRARAVALSLGELHARGARAAGARRQRDRARGGQAHAWAAPPRSASAAIPTSRWTCCRRSRSCVPPGSPVVMLGQVHREMPFMLGAAQRGRRQPSICCSTTRATTTTCSRRRIRRCRRWITPSACTRARWCATAARCRSASASSATRSSIRCCCATSRTRRGAARSSTRAPNAARRSIDAVGGRAPFTTGLFGATEMFVDQMLDLYRAGILRRRVYDYLPLQRALAANGSSTRVDAALLEGHAAPRARARCSAPPTWPHSRPPASCAARRASTTATSSRPMARASRPISASANARGRTGARLPGAQAAGRHGHARRIPARPARVLCGAVRVAGDPSAGCSTCAAWATSTSSTASDHALRVAQRSHARFVNTDDDADHAGRRGLRWARRRPRGVRRRRPVQLRRHGARAARRAFGAVRARRRAARTAS